MSRLDEAERVIADLGRAWGFEGVALDHSGRLSLSFNEMVVCVSYVEHPIEALWINADLGDLQGDSLRALPYLLEMNMRLWSRNLMTVSATEDGKRVIGFTMIPLATLTLERIKAVMEQMVREGLTIRKEVRMAAFRDAPWSDADALPAGPVIPG